MIRAFLAIDLPESLRPGLALCSSELKMSQADVRWVPPGNIHITLKFFGNTPDAEAAAHHLRGPAGGLPAGPPDPRGRRRRGLPQQPQPPGGVAGPGRGPAAFEPVFSAVGKGLRWARLSAGGPGLQPPPDLGPGALARGPGAVEPGHRQTGIAWPPFRVREIILYQSVLSPRGSTYTPLEVIKLSEQ